jgi:hypothetical protein
VFVRQQGDGLAPHDGLLATSSGSPDSNGVSVSERPERSDKFLLGHLLFEDSSMSELGPEAVVKKSWSDVGLTAHLQAKFLRLKLATARILQPNRL